MSVNSLNFYYLTSSSLEAKERGRSTLLSTPTCHITPEHPDGLQESAEMAHLGDPDGLQVVPVLDGGQLLRREVAILREGLQEVEVITEPARSQLLLVTGL